MAVYILPRERGPAVRQGRQRLTLVAPRNAPTTAPHARLGEAVALDLAARADKKRERVAVRDCILRASVVITPDALVRVLGPIFHERGPHTAQAERIARHLRAAEQGAAGDTAAARLALARLAGFRSWKCLYDWNAARDRRGRPDADGRVTRELIGWAA